ncbi:hypothetical protein B4U79_18934, partial [Dinothrombium tinctorium]
MQICESESQEKISNESRKVHFNDDTSVEILDELRNYSQDEDIVPKGECDTSETSFYRLQMSSHENDARDNNSNPDLLQDTSENFMCKHCSEHCCCSSNAFEIDEQQQHHRTKEFYAHCSRCNFVPITTDSLSMEQCFSPSCLSDNVTNAVLSEVPMATINSDNLCSFVPFLLVTGILTLTLVLLVSSMEILNLTRHKYDLPLQEKSVTQETQCILDEISSEVRCRCDPLSCENQALDPVCGNDNITYPNECRLNLASCNLQKLIIIRHRGLC